MIIFDKVSKSFGEHVLFKDVSFEIKKGEFVVFSGVSGCGKTTMLNMIGGLEKLSGGTILVDNVDVSKRQNQLEYFRNKVGFLFQTFALIENKTVFQNLDMIKTDCRSEITIEDAMAKVGLSDKLNAKIYTLSGGEQQRVALARLMVKKCDLILADEPTGSLDKGNASAVIDILKEMNTNQGKTVIMVTHDDELKKQGNRIINL
ncbi:MAG: ABC transporter ATP-binding protein [Clostridiales bacterium]|nr:ABC transporter ATP-binding protein [Clostridiales bacterium]